MTKSGVVEAGTKSPESHQQGQISCMELSSRFCMKFEGKTQVEVETRGYQKCQKVGFSPGNVVGTG